MTQSAVLMMRLVEAADRSLRTCVLVATKLALLLLTTPLVPLVESPIQSVFLNSGELRKNKP